MYIYIQQYTYCIRIILCVCNFFLKKTPSQKVFLHYPKCSKSFYFLFLVGSFRNNIVHKHIAQTSRYAYNIFIRNVYLRPKFVFVIYHYVINLDISSFDGSESGGGLQLSELCMTRCGKLSTFAAPFNLHAV